MQCNKKLEVSHKNYQLLVEHNFATYYFYLLSSHKDIINNQKKIMRLNTL